MTDKLKELILNTAKDIFESQTDEPLTQSEVENMLFEFVQLAIKYNNDKI